MASVLRSLTSPSGEEPSDGGWRCTPCRGPVTASATRKRRAPCWRLLGSSLNHRTRSLPVPTPPEGPTHNVSCTKATSTIGGSRLVDAACDSMPQTVCDAAIRFYLSAALENW